MSSNGTRKETRGWEISPTTQSGKMINIDTDDVPIEAIESISAAVTVVAPTPMPGMAPPPVPSAPTEVRARRTTLETFNDEMAVLDRPLENEVEYVDEAPQPSRWRGVALFAGIVLGLGMGGGVIMSRRQPAVAPIAQAPQAAAPVAAAPVPAPVAAAAPAAPAAAEAPAAPAEEPVLAAQVPAAPQAAAAAAEDDEADEASAAAPSSHGAWTKVKSSSHGKHAAAAKSAHHRSGKRAVAKHAGSRR
jgi:hypothetical protein